MFRVTQLARLATRRLTTSNLLSRPILRTTSVVVGQTQHSQTVTCNWTPVRDFSKKKEDRSSKKSANKAGKSNSQSTAEVGEAFEDAQFRDKMQSALDHLEQEFDNMRLGRPVPEQLHNVQVKVFGSHMPLKSLGQIYFRRPQSLIVSSHDPSHITPIMEAIGTCGLDLNPVRETDPSGGVIIAVPFPKPSKEMRDSMIKMAKAKAEEVRTSIRHTRKLWLDKIKQNVPAEDEAKRLEKVAQTATDKFIEDVNKHLSSKETELNSVQ